MVDRLAFVHADLYGTAHPVGRLYSHNNKGKETASFEYEREWLENPLRYSLEPALALTTGQFYTARVSLVRLAILHLTDGGGR